MNYKTRNLGYNARMPFQAPYLTKDELSKELQRNGLLTKHVEKALEYAERAHKNQKRDLGKPYLEEHIYPIAASILKHDDNDPAMEDVLILGILHDTIEDSLGITPGGIEQEFGKDMLVNLLLLTKKQEDNLPSLSEGQKMSINKMMLEKIEHAPRSVQIVKLEDRLNNLSSFEKPDTPKYQRYVIETRELFIPFAEKTIPLYKELFLNRLADLGNMA